MSMAENRKKAAKPPIRMRGCLIKAVKFQITNARNKTSTIKIVRDIRIKIMTKNKEIMMP